MKHGTARGSMGMGALHTSHNPLARIRPSASYESHQLEGAAAGHEDGAGQVLAMLVDSPIIGATNHAFDGDQAKVALHA